MSFAGPGRLMAAAILLTSAVTLSGCKTWGDNAVEQGAPEQLYERGNNALGSGDFDGAVRVYEAL